MTTGRDYRDARAYDAAMGRLDRAELIDRMPKKQRPEVRHSEACRDDEGKLECVCNGGLWAAHPEWDRP